MNDVKNKTAMITGITGQDGSYLAKFLLKKGYRVHGLVRPSSGSDYWRIKEIINQVKLHECDMTCSSSISKALFQIKPTEIYHLAAQSHVGRSFNIPEYTADVTAISTLRILESIRTLNLGKDTKFYQASSSELYGNPVEFPQNENTPFNPISPYAIAKLHAFWTTRFYRDTYKLFACNGIMFNHESPFRGEMFVTRKITKTLCNIVIGTEKCLYLGNLDAERDWGHAEEYVEMQWAMLQQDEPEDFVIATGVKHTVREFLNMSALQLGIELLYKGKGTDEIAIVANVRGDKTHSIKPGDVIVRVMPEYFRDNDVRALLGDSRKAQQQLKWTPKKTLEDICKEMIQYDYSLQLHKSQINTIY